MRFIKSKAIALSMLVLLVAFGASATEPVFIEYQNVTTPTLLEMKCTDDGNLVFEFALNIVFSGDIVGIATGLGRTNLEGGCGIGGITKVIGTSISNFTGTVLDSEPGTLIFRTNGTGPFPFVGTFAGNWGILQGSEGLANVHGTGEFFATAAGPMGPLLHEGQIHFDPAAAE